MSENNRAMIDLYRFFDADGDLLYVGISLHAAIRALDHRREKSWWPEVANISVEHLDLSRYDASRMERRAIQLEQPRYNIAETAPPSKATTKFQCSTCNKGVASFGFVLVPRSALPEGDRLTTAIAAYQFAAAVAESKQFDSWVVEHPTAKCRASARREYVILDILDVWALHVGARPAFTAHDPETTYGLLSAWWSGEL